MATAKKMSKLIKLPKGNRFKIAKALGLTDGYVSSILNFSFNNEMAVKVRHIALTEYGGRLLVETPYTPDQLDLIKE